MPKPPAAKPPALQDLIAAEPDLVDRIFDYLLAEFPQIAGLPPDKIATTKAAVRAEFKGEECYIAGRPASARQEMVSNVLALFNGRNAAEVARRLQISRRTVYRIIKQPGGVKKVPTFRDLAQ
ncbi:MAG TPA: helix-turn-helix domain-containing protein [Brevundimonas sp.]|uniref:helix-turn-helix domain-containing protein n=1 Tax=Brevundimonas sp. TaxID=1871086 RepID=UPI002B99CAD8|nr:helix-turn-helix domain-containing protein [Brevundimonas sp.]HRH21476.1 helix-turn-helix domain-containing protein [Brevundimonas sp.]